MLQHEALTILKTGANVFLTGEPGAGKTHVTNAYVAWLKAHGITPAVTASTGIAATHIGGMTIHAWSGIGILKTLSKYDLDHISQNKNVVSRILNATTLIIDEVSMLADTTLNMVDMVCKEVRRNKEPFGGLQVVLVGDFFQLPPVVRKSAEGAEASELFDDKEHRTPFAFGSAAWKTLDPVVCYLSEQYRQSDETFLDLLSALRSNTAGESQKKVLRTRYTKNAHEDTTRLFSHNADVDRINSERLAELSEQEHAFDMEARGPARLVESLIKNCLSPQTLVLKVGARVMFTKNDTERKYVNGTLGTITGFSEYGGYPIVQTHAGKTVTAEPDEWRIDDGGKTLARITQVPLRLAWAITVHKSQGMSLDSAHMDLSQVFEYGQGYVALSRVRTLQGLTISGLNDMALRVHPEAHTQDSLFLQESDDAQQAFANIPDAELKGMHDRFVKASGGKEPTKANELPVLQNSTTKKVSKKTKVQRGDTYKKTLTLLHNNKSVADIAHERGLATSTVWGHVRELYMQGQLQKNDVQKLAPKDFEAVLPKIKKAFTKSKDGKLKSVFELLGGTVSYDYLRLAQLLLHNL